MDSLPLQCGKSPLLVDLFHEVLRRLIDLVPGIDQIRVAVGFAGSGSLGFENELPGKPEQSPDRQLLLETKTVAVFSFDIDSRKVTLESTAENFGHGEWKQVRDEVSQSFPSFTWPNTSLDVDVYREILKNASPELESDWIPLAHWEDRFAVVASRKEDFELMFLRGFPVEDLRLYDTRSAKFTGLPTLETSRDALDLSDHIVDYRVSDARSLDHISPTTLTNIEATHLIYQADWAVDGHIDLKSVDFGDTNKASDRENFILSILLRLTLDAPPIRTIHPQKGFTGEEVAGPGTSLHVGLDGDVIFHVGRYRGFQGILVYDGHSGKLLYRMNAETLSLSGADSIGSSFMETNDCLLVATQPGLVRIQRNADGEWGHTIEKHP